jgi:hypothetical protein
MENRVKRGGSQGEAGPTLPPVAAVWSFAVPIPFTLIHPRACSHSLGPLPWSTASLQFGDLLSFARRVGLAGISTGFCPASPDFFSGKYVFSRLSFRHRYSSSAPLLVLDGSNRLNRCSTSPDFFVRCNYSRLILRRKYSSSALLSSIRF